MRISQKGIDLIKQFEGCRLNAYKCVSTEEYYTIGYGHYGADVDRNATITQQQAEDYLKADLRKYENYVNNKKYCPRINELNQNQFDALVSFTYNCGCGNLIKLCKNRTLEQISCAMLLYNKSGGVVLKGLTRRRKAEQKLFNTPITTAKPTAKKSNEEIAKEVVAGKWGNGEERKNALTKAGYNYRDVQNIVNKIVRNML